MHLPVKGFPGSLWPWHEPAQHGVPSAVHKSPFGMHLEASAASGRDASITGAADASEPASADGGVALLQAVTSKGKTKSKSESGMKELMGPRTRNEIRCGSFERCCRLDR